MLSTFFSRCYVINLDDDVERLAAFRARTAPVRWPFAEPQRWRAVPGKKAPHPDWWRAGGGAWGCLRSHLQIIEQSLVDEVPSVLILEDDAIPCDDFATKAEAFLANVPSDWGMIYLGGQHLFAGSHPPERVNAEVFRPYNVNRTHAFALSQAGMKTVYKHLCRQDWQSAQHIDHHLGRLHMNGQLPVYCPPQWLIGQAGGKSRISGRTPGLRYWQHASHLTKDIPSKPVPVREPFIAIIGLHSSGSSAVAGICWHLGLHLGNTLTGFHKVDPNHPRQRGFEAQGLANICERAASFPGTAINNPARLQKELARWIRDRQHEAAQRRTVAGGKYPHLCRLGEQLQAICGDALFVIHCDRNLEESIASLAARVQAHPPHCSAEAAAAVQRWLHDGKRQFLADVPGERQITISYDALLEDPQQEVRRIAEFLSSALQLSPTPQQITEAIGIVQPEKRHVRLAAPT
jgi:hypothetical protein